MKRTSSRDDGWWLRKNWDRRRRILSTSRWKDKDERRRVYIHVKGYVRARVTHVDVEDDAFGKIIHRGRGNTLEIIGIEDGIEIMKKLEEVAKKI